MIEGLAKRTIISGKIFTQSIKEHGEHALEVYRKIEELYDIEKTLLHILKESIKSSKIKENTINSAIYLVKEAILTHDTGKRRKGFQEHIRRIHNGNGKNHSTLSALIYISNNFEYIENLDLKRRDKHILKCITIRISYLISKHHSKLGNYDIDVYFNSLDAMKDEYSNNCDLDLDIDIFQDSISSFNENIYIFDRLFQSVLLTSDVVSSYEFQNNTEFEFNCLSSKDKLMCFDKFEHTDIVKSIRSESDKTKINEVRSEIFLKTEERLSDADLYFLEAQTGSGKTVTSLNLAKNLVRKGANKIVYTAPYKSILFQTEEVISEMLTDDYIISNEDANIYINEKNDDYDNDLLNNTLINNKVALVSHVKLFDILFGETRQAVTPLFSLVNSVIVLDEIQSYKNMKWISIINMIAKYSKLLNIKFIIMSATLPKLDKLIEEDIKVKYLLDDKEVSEYKEFFNKRVTTHFDMLDCEYESDYDVRTKQTFEKIDEKIIGNKKAKKIIIGLIRNDTSFMFYKRFSEMYKDYDVLLLNSTTNKGSRKRIINRINDISNTKGIILIATQVVEAGVDISMDIGFKDYAILDSDLQFRGRIARNFEKTGDLYIFKLDDYRFIYKDDLRTKYDLGSKDGQEIFLDEEFEKVYEATFLRLNRINTLRHIYKMMKDMKFSDVAKEMKLIEQNSINLLISNEESNSTIEDIQKILKIEDYSKKKILFKNKYNELKPHIVKCSIYGDESNIPLKRDDELNVYYIEDFLKYTQQNDYGDVFYINEYKKDYNII